MAEMNQEEFHKQLEPRAVEEGMKKLEHAVIEWLEVGDVAQAKELAVALVQIKRGSYDYSVRGQVQEAIRLGWQPEDTEIASVYLTYSGVQVDFTLPNGYNIHAFVYPKEHKHYPKEEFLAIEKEAEDIIKAASIKALEKLRKKLEECNRRVQELEGEEEEEEDP